MRSRAVRVTLLLLAVGALGTAAYLTWDIDRRTAVSSAAFTEADWKIDALVRQTVELRAAQQAYVAAGQSEQFWITRAGDLTTQLQEALSSIRTAQLSADSQAALAKASQALTDFSRVDRRAREYASSGQKLLASDIIFGDGLERTQQILAALDEAKTSEAAVANTSAAAARREMAKMAGGGAAVALLVLLLLTSTGQPPKAEAVDEVPTAIAPRTKAAKASEPLDLDLVPRAIAPPPKAAPKPAPKAAEPPPVPVAAPASPPPALRDVAEVCSQLARAADTSAFPEILQRAAAALDAAGVVLWISDPDATELIAVASHGYAQAVLTRMSPIVRDAENVTAAAFRTGLVQTVSGDGRSNGAIAAPLVNASGCVGVLSAEVRNDGEREPARLALASIVAAQLATLTAPASRSQNRAAL
jgi:hypothetical protein